jgi:hypothetical protein
MKITKFKRTSKRCIPLYFEEDSDECCDEISFKLNRVPAAHLGLQSLSW